MLNSISRVNCETLRSFRDIRLELLDQIAAQGQVWAERMNRLEEMESKLEKKSQEFLDRQERKK